MGIYAAWSSFAPAAQIARRSTSVAIKGVGKYPGLLSFMLRSAGVLGARGACACKAQITISPSGGKNTRDYS